MEKLYLLGIMNIFQKAVFLCILSHNCNSSAAQNTVIELFYYPKNIFLYNRGSFGGFNSDNSEKAILLLWRNNEKMLNFRKEDRQQEGEGLRRRLLLEIEYLVLQIFKQSSVVSNKKLFSQPPWKCFASAQSLVLSSAEAGGVHAFSGYSMNWLRQHNNSFLLRSILSLTSH